jgi:hypothetical protein
LVMDADKQPPAKKKRTWKQVHRNQLVRTWGWKKQQNCFWHLLARQCWIFQPFPWLYVCVFGLLVWYVQLACWVHLNLWTMAAILQSVNFG